MQESCMRSIRYDFHFVDSFVQLKYPQDKPLDGESAPRNALILKKRSGVYQYNREVTRRFDLTPGTYVIIPSTFRPHEEAEFMLRIYTEKIINSL